MYMYVCMHVGKNTKQIWALKKAHTQIFTATSKMDKQQDQQAGKSITCRTCNGQRRGSNKRKTYHLPLHHLQNNCKCLSAHLIHIYILI